MKEKIWGPDDTYNVVEVQVFNFEKGDKVKVTIESVEDEVSE